MKPIRDCKGRVVCVCNSADGTIEIKHKKLKTISKIPVGEAYTIERDGVKTVITRCCPSSLDVESYEKC